MSEITKPIITDSPFKDYVHFLLNNHLDSLLTEHAESIDDVEKFFYDALNPLPDDAGDFPLSSMKDFLTNIVEDITIKDVKQNIINLVKIKLLEVYNLEVLLSGIRLFYRLRKESIFEYLFQYSTSTQQIISIALEIDILFSEIEEYTFQVLSKYSRERTALLKEQLFETQELVEKLTKENLELYQKLSIISL